VVLSTLAFSFVVTNDVAGSQWATWWWVCIGGLIVFIPTIFTVTGYWRPSSARAAVRRTQEQEMSVETA